MPRLILAFIVAYAYSLICSLFTWATAQGWSHVHLAIIADLVSPVVQVLAVVWIAEAKTWPQRARLCGVTSIGYALGTISILWWTR